MKLRAKTFWRICLVTLLVVLLLAFCVPWRRVWQRVKVPVLVQCVHHGPAATRRWAAIFLSTSDGDKKMITSVLLPGLKDKDEGVREMTAIALGHIHQEPERIVPALFACIDAETNPASQVPNYALGTIGAFGTNARPWSPILVKWIGTNDFGWWKDKQMWTLAKIDPDAARPLFQLRGGVYSNLFWEMENHPHQQTQKSDLPPSGKHPATTD